MQISFNTHAGGLDITQGYGYAGYHIINSLQELGHSTPFNDPHSPVLLNFTQPWYYQYHPGQYNIGYTPWESSKLHDSWADHMNACDEVWTTSDLCEKWFRQEGVTKPIYVYEHGIDHAWAPMRRVHSSKLRFLHIGEPAPRKCGQMVLDAFTELFGNDTDYELTIKANGFSTVRGHYPDGSIGNPVEMFKNVFLVRELLDLDSLISLYYKNHVLVYPSWGEGFGFIPLQGMATGMPVIFNTSWAPYRRFSVGLDIADTEVMSLDPNTHPGNTLLPDFDSLKEQMRNAANDYNTYSQKAFELAPLIHEEYDWVNLTRNAFDHVVKKFETS